MEIPNNYSWKEGLYIETGPDDMSDSGGTKAIRIAFQNWFRGPFHEQFFSRNSNSMEVCFYCNAIIGHHITTKFDTCHVMPCAKFHSNRFTTALMRMKLIFH